MWTYHIPMVGIYYIELLTGKTFWEKNMATYFKNLKHKGTCWLKKK